MLTWHRKINLHCPLPMSTCFILMRMHSSLEIQVPLHHLPSSSLIPEPQHTCVMIIHIIPPTVKLILLGQFTWLTTVYLRQLVLEISLSVLTTMDSQSPASSKGPFISLSSVHLYYPFLNWLMLE